VNETGTRPDVRASNRGFPRRALVVDDNRDNTESLALLLRMHADDVRTAHDGVAALELGERFRPQVILLDIGMPLMNGYETCRAMRERARGRDAIVIAQTGRSQPEDHERARQRVSTRNWSGRSNSPRSPNCWRRSTGVRGSATWRSRRVRAAPEPGSWYFA